MTSFTTIIIICIKTKKDDKNLHHPIFASK